MQLINLSSDRAYLLDIDCDGAEELIYTKLSNIVITDPRRGKVKRVIKVKPKAEKQRDLYEQRIYRSISTETNISLRDVSSFAGEVVLKLAISDVDGDGRSEIIILRVDGILACYGLDGSEKWSFFLDPYIVDLAVEERGYIRVVAISRYGYLYAVTMDAKFYRVSLENLSRSTISIVSLDPSDDTYAILMQEGMLYVIKLKISREKLKRTIKLEVLADISLPRHAESTSLCALDIDDDGIQEVVIGLADGTILIADWRAEKVSVSTKLPDKISCIYRLPGVEEPVVIVLDWFGNLAIIRGLNRIDVYEASPRRVSIDLDGDSVEEEISVFTKNLRVRKQGELISEIRGFSYISAYFIDDINGDGEKELIVAWNSKTVTIYSSSGQLIDSTKTSAIPRAIFVDDLDRDGKKEIVVCSNNSVEIFKIS